MKLKKMITVSAAALMLAGVGASASNAGSSVHASRRTVRVSRQLSAKKSGLLRQIKSDQFQVKQINREMARLNRKSVHKGKRSKKVVKHRKHTKKANQKRRTKKVTRRQTKRNAKKRATTNKSVKTVKRGVVDRKAGTFHMQKNGNVYTFNVTSKGYPITSSEKKVSSLKAYTKKNGTSLQKEVSTFNQLLKAYQQNPKANAKYVSVLMQLRSGITHMMPYKNI